MLNKILMAVQYIIFTIITIVGVVALLSMVRGLIDGRWAYSGLCWIVGVGCGVCMIFMADKEFLFKE